MRCYRDVKRERVKNGRVWCVTVPPHHLVLARRAHLEHGIITKASRSVIVGQCYGWKSQPNAPFPVTYNAQSDSTKQEF
jgi:hypothetical protein